MQHTSLRSYWTRPRGLEATAHIASWVAVILTVVMVGTAQVAEANPVTRQLIDAVGLRGFALLTPLLLSALYRLLHRYADHHVFFALPAGLLVADAIGNLAAVIHLGPPETALWGEIATTALLAGAVAVACYCRAGCWVQAHTPRPALRVGAAALLVVTAMVVPFVGLQTTMSPVGTASAAPEFCETFENESADAGVPDNWENWSTYTADTLEVTEVSGSGGSQAFHAVESSGSNQVSIVPSEQPFASNTTAEITTTYRVENLSADSDVSYAKLILDEGSNRVVTVELQEDGLYYTDSSFTSNKVTGEVGAGEWVNVTASDFDPANNTFTLSWESDSASGSKSGLDMYGDMTNGYDKSKYTLNGESYVDDVGISCTSISAKSISGTVTNQNGQPVPNASVRITTVDTSSLSTDGAFDKLDNASDVTPDAYDRNLDLRGQVFDTDKTYVAATQADISDGSNFLVDGGDIGSPQLTFPAGEPIVFTAWDGGNEGWVEDEYDSQLPGTARDEATITIEQLSPTGESVQRQNLTLDQQAGGDFVDPSTLNYAETTLTPGFYRISAADSDVSYVIRVGSVRAIIAKELNTINSQFAERAQWIQDQINSGPLEMQTVTTNATGHFATDYASNVDVVAVQAVKASSLPTDPQNQSADAIRENASQLNGSVYMPSRVHKYNLPKSGAQVRVVEVTYPPYGNLTDYRDKWQTLMNQLKNGSFDDMPPAFQQAVQNLTREELENTNARLERLTEENERLRQRYEDIADERNINIDVDSGEASREELKQQISALKQAIEEINDPVPVEPVAPPSTGNGTISRTWAVNGDVTEAGTVVRLDYSNGTTRYLNATSSEYVTIDGRVGRTDHVTLSEFPLGETDPATVSVTPIIATEQGVGRHTGSITNPTFDGDVPSLRSVDVDTFRPETGEPFNLTMRPDADSGYANVTGATVYGPDGSTVNATTTTNSVEFTPSQTGVHKVRVTMQNTGGTQFTETLTVKAVANGNARPASIRAVSGPTGTYALAGSGLSGGDITVRDGGAAVDVTAIADDESEDVPNEVHVYTAGLATAPDVTYNVGVVEGDSERALSQNVRVTLHGPPLEDGDYVYREANDDSQPLPRGKSPDGIVNANPTNSSIQTYTSNEGSVGIRVNSDPSRWDQINWLIDTNLPDISLPDVGFIAPLGGVPA